MPAEPAGEIIRIIEVALRRGRCDAGRRSQRGLRGLKAVAIAEGAQTEARFAFQLPRQVIGVVAEVAGDFAERAGGPHVIAELFKEARCGRWHGGSMTEQARHDSEDGGVIAEGEAAFARHAGEQRVQFIQRGWIEAAVRGANATVALKLVVKDEAKRTAVPRGGESVRHARWNHKEIPGPGAAGAGVHGLHALAREIEDELGKLVAVGSHLGLSVAVELELPQHEPQCVNLDFLDEERTPRVHRVGFVLAKAGFVLTQAGASR